MRIIIFSILYLYLIFYLFPKFFKDLEFHKYYRKLRRRAQVRKMCNDNLFKSFIKNIKGTYKDIKYYYKIKKQI